ncbi:MAG TPA: hypothetical protein PLX85_06255, partial [Dehalococcoidia bacterium]|nr:hypothetical protein [Dehalococcoidia bacterium]
RSAATRARDGAVAAYTSPRTRQARANVALYTRRAAAGAADATRRGSTYVRQQYERDARQTLIVGGVVVAVIVLVLVLLVSALSGGGDDPTASSGNAGAVQPGIGTPAASGTNGGTVASARSSTATAAAAATLPGNPYSETAVLAAMQARGLTPTLSTDAFACDNPGTTPKSYRVSTNGGEQRVVLLIYPDAAAFGRDWVVGAGRPQYRNGACGAGAAVVYFNANVMIVFPQTTNAGVQSQISDAFLTLP